MGICSYCFILLEMISSIFLTSKVRLFPFSCCCLLNTIIFFVVTTLSFWREPLSVFSKWTISDPERISSLLFKPSLLEEVRFLGGHWIIIFPPGKGAVYQISLGIYGPVIHEFNNRWNLARDRVGVAVIHTQMKKKWCELLKKKILKW